MPKSCSFSPRLIKALWQAGALSLFALPAIAQQVQTPVPVASPDELERMKQFLTKRNDPRIVVKTIQVEGGEDIDCVDAVRQHGYDSPIELRKPPKAVLEGALSAPLPPGAQVAVQDYGTRTERCPDDTIPRVRLTIEHLSQYRSLEEFHDLYGGRNKKFAPTVDPTYREHAVGTQSVAAARGASTIMSVNKPLDEHSEEMTLSQLWLVGLPGLANQETIEVGWQVYRGRLMGSRNPHLFVYWSAFNYTVGCYDDDCPGWNAQPGASYVPGVAFSNWSTPGGTQVYVKVVVARDVNTTGDWWVTINDEVIGWFDGGSFHDPGIASFADRVDFGGEVSPGIDYGRHSRIDMGSGQYANQGWGFAAFHTATQWAKYNATTPASYDWFWSSLSPATTRPDCYSLVFADPPQNSAFYFGGPGYGAGVCP